MAVSVPEYDITITHGAIEEGIHKLLGIIREQWGKDELKLKFPNNGFVNTVAIASYKDNVDDDAVVIKVFSKSLNITYPPKDVKKKVANVLNALGLSAPLICQFNNGTVHKFVQGKTFSWDDEEHDKRIQNVDIGKSVMRLVAKYHCNRTKKVAESIGIQFSDSHIFNLSAKILENWPTLDDPRFKEVAPKKILQEELNKLKNMADEMKLEIALGHSDVALTNVIQSEDDNLTLIDYDNTTSEYVIFDLVWFFITTYLTQKEKNEHKELDKNLTTSLIREYLNERRRLGDFKKDITDEDVDRYFRHVQKFRLFVTYAGITEGVLFAANPSETEVPYAFDRLGSILNKQEQYFRLRDEIMAIKND